MKHEAVDASRIARLMALAVALLGAHAGIVHGQSAIYGAGLQAWLGCWAADPWSMRGEASPPIVCIAPTADRNVADVFTVQDGRVVSRETLDASGRQRPIDAERCTGVRSASWSGDGRRLFVRSSGRCAGVPSSTSGLLSITAEGDWLDVEGIAAGGATSVRVARYREVAMPPSLPAAASSALRAQSLATRSIRVAAAAPVRTDDVLEASRAVDSTVLEAWILERAQRFEIAEGDIGALLRAGVPSRVADALAAAVEPQSYALVRADDELTSTERSTSYYDAYGLPFGWGWSWGYYLPIATRYGYSHRDPRRYGHYRPPLVIHGLAGRPRGRGEQGRGWHQPGDGRDGRDGRHGLDGRDGRGGRGGGDPRRSSPASGGTVRLGRP